MAIEEQTQEKCSAAVSTYIHHFCLRRNILFKRISGNGIAISHIDLNGRKQLYEEAVQESHQLVLIWSRYYRLFVFQTLPPLSVCLSVCLSIYIVTSPFHKSHLNWVHDPAPPPSRRLESTDTVPRSDSRVNSSVPIPRNPLAPIPVPLGIIPVFLTPVFPISVTLCAQIHAVCPSIRKVKTRCPPLLRAAHQ